MSEAIRVSPCLQQALHQRKLVGFSSSIGFAPILQSFSISHIKTSFLFRTSLVSQKGMNGIRGRIMQANVVTVEGSSQDLDSPGSVDLQPISSEEQFDRIIAEAQQLEVPMVVVWVATWCRKCIYLKPKLEKLAADFYPRVRFYSIDVNSVPQKLVTRAGVTPTELNLQKMPTVQLWKDSQKQAEVIGGHKAYLVVNEVREMIHNESTL